ncbi:MAG: ABC transporter permease [Candidatus Ventricola sp.]
MAGCIRAELCKLRGAWVFAVLLLLPAISAAYGTFNYWQNREILTNGWMSLYTQHTLFDALFFFSPMIGVFAAYQWRLEHVGRNLYTMLSAPVPPLACFAAKALIVYALALMTQGWTLLLYIVCGRMLCGLPGLPPVSIVLYMLRGMLGAAPIVALQTLLSMVSPGFAMPVLLALVGGVAGMGFATEGAGLCWPYALMILGMNANRNEDMLSGGLGGYVLVCAGYTLAIFLLAQLLLTKRDVRA